MLTSPRTQPKKLPSQIGIQIYLVLGADAVAANFATLNVLQLQLGDEVLNVGGAFDVVLVA